MLTIDLESTIPLGDQVRAGIRRAIAIGELSPGDPLPTVRQLGQDLGINLNTVARAYRQLELDGLVTTKRGRGTYLRSGREKESSGASTLARLTAEARNFLANARLAGLPRAKVEKMLERELSLFWSKERSR